MPRLRSRMAGGGGRAALRGGGPRCAISCRRWSAAWRSSACSWATRPIGTWSGSTARGRTSSSSCSPCEGASCRSRAPGPLPGRSSPARSCSPPSSASTTSARPPPDEVLVPSSPPTPGRSPTCSRSAGAGGCGSSSPSAAPSPTCSRRRGGTPSSRFRSWREEGERRDEALAALTRSLHLAREPRWMECYDISTFQGALAVGSGVSMKDGEPDRANYRRYKVRGVPGQDDFAMLHEVLSRRLRRALAEGAFPDLIVIDGGKGQLSAALAAARDLGIADRGRSRATRGAPFVQMVGAREEPGARRRRPRHHAGGGPPRLAGGSRWPRRPSARGPGFRRRGARAARSASSLPGRKDPIVLRQNSAELFLLVRLARRGAPLRDRVSPQAAPRTEPRSRCWRRSRASGRGGRRRCCATSGRSSACARPPSRRSPG